MFKFLDAADRKLRWPLDGAELSSRKKGEALFSTLSAQRALFKVSGHARHRDAACLAARWRIRRLVSQGARPLRKDGHRRFAGALASLSRRAQLGGARLRHAVSGTALHFNGLHELRPVLYAIAGKFVVYCAESLILQPASDDFAAEFAESIGGI